MKTIKIYEVFKLNHVLDQLLQQQPMYNIQTAFKIYQVKKWLDDTEKFIFDRKQMVFNTTTIDADNPAHMAFLYTELPFLETDLSLHELLVTEGEVKIDVMDMGVLEKMFNKNEG